MAVKKTGISRDLIIHPGETIADVLEDRGITQAELAAITDVTPAHVSNVISGKKNISAKFAFALEYALGIPKSFWLNLQANFDAELLEFNEAQSITEEERIARKSLADIVKYLRQNGKIPIAEKVDESILSLRKALQISNIGKLKDVASVGAFRMNARTNIDPYVLGAWVRLCQIAGEGRGVQTRFDANNIDCLMADIKNVMKNPEANIQGDLRRVMGNYGIDFSVVKNFRGAPVQGYISEKQDGSCQIAMTIRGAYADIFWFSLFHELGHLVNGDIGKSSKFIDYGGDDGKEEAADLFARDRLMNPGEYKAFVDKGLFDLKSIIEFSEQQNVMPFILIGRLQKEKYLSYNQYSDYKVRYKWAS